MHKTSFPRFCFLALKKEKYIIHGFLDFFFLRNKKYVYSIICSVFCFLRMKEGKYISNISLVLFPLIQEKKLQISSFLRLFPWIEGKGLDNTWFLRFWILQMFIPGFPRFCFLRLKERKCITHWFLGLFTSTQERKLQISSLLRFGFLRFKAGIWVTHDLFGFESLNWRKERMYARVSSVFLPSIEERNICNFWFSKFWFLGAEVSSVFFP